MDLAKIVEKVQKQYGEGSIYRIDSHADLAPPKTISTGSMILDWKVLRIGGIPRGRVLELYGLEGSGKTTVCLHIIANAQSMGLNVAFIDAEHKLDKLYAASLGVDVTKLYISEPDNGEIALDIADALCKADDLHLIIFDSAAALGSKLEVERKFAENADVGKTPRLINKFFRRNLSNIREKEIAVIFTNQIRDKIGSFIPGQTTTTGGHGLQHYSSVLLSLTRIGDIKNSDKIVVGHKVKAFAKKNNVAVPKRVGEFKIWYGTGIDLMSDTLDYALDLGVLVKRGAFYRYENEIIGQGEIKAIAFLRDNPDVAESIRVECEKWIQERMVK